MNKYQSSTLLMALAIIAATINVVGFQNAVMEVMAVQVMVAVTPVIHDNNII
jgi:hypothetical protein